MDFGKIKAQVKKALILIGGSLLSIFLIIFGTIGIISLSASSQQANVDNIKVVKSDGKFNTNKWNEKIGYEITGSISNNNSYNVAYTEIEVTFCDKSGNIIDTFNTTNKFRLFY